MWNKREKEVAQHQLNAEQKVLKQLEHQYRLALEDVKLAIQIMMTDDQTISKIHQIKYQKTLQKQLEGILEKLHLGEYKSLKQYLNDCYTDAFVGTMYDMHGQGVPVIAPVDQQAAIKAIQLETKLADRKIHPNANGEMVALYESLGIDTDKLKQTIRQEITRGIASGMRFEDIARNIANVSKAPLSRAKTIARTEGHRIQQASAEDARQLAKSKGADVVKQWDASLDGATRQTHKELDGQIQEVNKPFKSGTKSAMYPGDFGDAAEDCNCRCAALTRARWALDEDELKVMQERAAVFGLSEDKKQTFEDFKKNFLKAAETLNNQGKNAIIKVKNSDLKNGLPIRGEPNSIVDKTDDDGKTLQRRIYGPDGLALFDYDTSDHGLPNAHPTGAHKHEYNHNKKRARSKPLPFTEEELLALADIISQGVNYHVEG